MTGSLTTPDLAVDQGTFLTFAYTVSADQVSDKNWVGLWPDPGNGPVDGSYVGPQTTYVYAPGASGSVTLSSGQLSPGSYLAFYLYDDGYTSICDPLHLTVRETPQVAPPAFTGDFGSRLGSPAGMTIDPRGHVWVADAFGGTVQQYDAHGRLRRTIGSRVLAEPRDVAVDAATVYVADAVRSVVDLFSTHGRHLATLGTGVLDRPRGVAVRGSELLVSDVGHNRVARFDLASRALVGEISTGVHIPHGIAVDGPRTWVVSSSRQYDGDCGVTCFVDDQPTITLGYGQQSYYGALSNPAHVAVDRDGTVLVSVPDLGFVSRFRPTGPFVGEFGTSGPGLLSCPQGVVVAGDGSILVADAGNRRVARFGGSR